MGNDFKARLNFLVKYYGDDRLNRFCQFITRRTQFDLTPAMFKKFTDEVTNNASTHQLSILFAILEALPDVSTEWLLKGDGYIKKEGNGLSQAAQGGGNAAAQEVDELKKTIENLNIIIKAKDEHINTLKDMLSLKR